MMQRNVVWNDHVNSKFQSALEKRTSCRTTVKLTLTQKVSLSSINRSLNEVAYVEHMHLDNIYVMKVMETASKYFAGDVVEDISV